MADVAGKRTKLVELIAEGKDELMEEYFERARSGRGSGAGFA
jgi:hypothetical protein